MKEGIPLDKESFIDESLTKAKKIPLGTNKDGTPKGLKPSKSKSSGSSKSAGKDAQSLARAEAELRTLREALQKALEERDATQEKCERLDAQLELMQLETANNGDGNAAKSKQLAEEAKQLKEDLDLAVRERDAASKQLENALERMQSMETGDTGNTQQEVLHYQQEAQQLTSLMEEQHSIIDDLVQAKMALEGQVAQEKGARQQAEAISEAATNEAASAIAAAEAAGEQLQGEQAQAIASGAVGLLECCEGLRRDLMTCR